MKWLKALQFIAKISTAVVKMALDIESVWDSSNYRKIDQ